MKEKETFRVPLSAAALELLERARQFDEGSGWVFPSPDKPGKALSDAACTRVLKDTGLHERTVPHGFRKSHRTWSEECIGFDYAVKEMALSHKVGSEVERIYQHSDLLEKRRRLMDQWAAFVTGSERAKVVSIGEQKVR